ncbi:replication licensing factor Cdt1 [Podochytrium sp. JEL0797]|nr:replication licensing factor Cdt1 [Podochytrium sp. JEL0797]
MTSTTATRRRSLPAKRQAKAGSSPLVQTELRGFFSVLGAAKASVPGKEFTFTKEVKGAPQCSNKLRLLSSGASSLQLKRPLLVPALYPLKKHKPESQEPSSTESLNQQQQKSDSSNKPAHFLPSHLILLLKIFKALESTLAFHSTRDKPPTFHLLKKPVENRTNRAFEKSHLEQILVLYPKAYHLTPVRVLVDSDVGRMEDTVMIEMIKLVVDAREPLGDGGSREEKVGGTADRDHRQGSEDDSGTSPTTSCEPTKSENASLKPLLFDKEKPFAEALERRVEFFKKACIRYVAGYHEEFLNSLSEEDKQKFTPPTSESSDTPTWHPDFDPESRVPEISATTPLPTVSSIAAASAASATAAAAAAATAAHSDTKLESTPTESAVPSDTPTTTSDTSVTVASDSPDSSDTPDTLNSLPVATCHEPVLPEPSETRTPPVPSTGPTPPLSRAAALLERIREKERKKKESLLLTPAKNYTPSELKHRAMISRLVEVGRSVIAYFTSRGKGALPMKDVCEYVISGVRSHISYEESRDHILLLAQTCPEWCSVVKLQVGTIVKFDARAEEMVGRLREKVKELLA